MVNFLKLNPQLKSLDYDETDGTVLEAIVQHVPLIEAVRFTAVFYFDKPKLFQCLKQLQALQTVQIIDFEIEDNQTNVEDLINVLVAANLPITTFRLNVINDVTNDVVNGAICKLQNLKTFDYMGTFVNTTEFPRLMHIYKNLPDLENIRISSCDVYHKISAVEIIQLLSCVKKLTSLEIEHIEIDLDDEDQKQIAAIIVKRSEKKHFKIMREGALFRCYAWLPSLC